MSDEPASSNAAAALRRALGSTRRRVRPSRRAGTDYSDDRGPVPIGQALDGLVRDQGWQQDAALARLLADWPAVVGPDVAGHVVPSGFREGELTVQADSTAWATQVRHLLPALRRAIDERIGAGVVTRISVVGPTAPSWNAGPWRVPGRGPRDTYG